jgi:hypothetical protein
LAKPQCNRALRLLPDEQPLCTTYKIASTIARRGRFGIRPGDLISGSIGSTISHCASVKFYGYRVSLHALLIEATPASDADTPCDTTVKHSEDV